MLTAAAEALDENAYDILNVLEWLYLKGTSIESHDVNVSGKQYSVEILEESETDGVCSTRKAIYKHEYLIWGYQCASYFVFNMIAKYRFLFVSSSG